MINDHRATIIKPHQWNWIMLALLTPNLTTKETGGNPNNNPNPNQKDSAILAKNQDTSGGTVP